MADTDDRGLPPVSFPSFVISLAQSAMVHLGETPDPASSKLKVQLPMARHTIDLLGLLKDKTEGNLEEDEAKLLDSLLAELREKFVEVSKRERGADA